MLTASRLALHPAYAACLRAPLASSRCLAPARATRLVSMSVRASSDAPTGSDDKAALETLIDRMSTYVGGEQLTAFDDDLLFIRPSGNPVTGKGMREMMSSDDITDIEGNLREIKILDICGDMAYASCVQDAKFKFKGEQQDDVYVQSYVFKKEHGAAETAEWRCVYGHRSTGRAPTEDAPGPWPTKTQKR